LLKNYPKFSKIEDLEIFEKLNEFFPLKRLPEWFGYEGYYIPTGKIYIFIHTLNTTYT